MIDGISSGIKSKEIIQKLKDVEKRPIKLLEKQKKENSLIIGALGKLNGLAKDLQKNLKALYGFEANFEKKEVISNPPGFIEGIANSKASPLEYKIQIKNKASALVFNSKGIKFDYEIKPGTVIFNEKEANFQGGTIKDFQRFLNDHYGDILTAKVIKKSAKKSILNIQSKTEGIKGIFNIQDKDSILKDMGLYDPDYLQKLKADSKITKERKFPILIEPEKLVTIEEGPYKISRNQKSLSLWNKGTKKLTTQPFERKGFDLKSISIQLIYDPLPSPERDTSPTSIYHGPVEELNIKGIRLFTYNPLRNRKIKTPKLPKWEYGVILHHKDKEPQNISLKDKRNVVRLPISNDLNGISFYTENARITFANLNWVYEIEDKKGTLERLKDKMTQKQKKMFPHLSQAAKNARLNIDGVDIERDSNKNIKDVIDGVTLNLLQKSDMPIKVNILNDLESPKKNILSFVESYNKLLKFIRETSTSEELVNKPGEFDPMAKLKGKTGALISDSSVRSLVNGLRRKVSDVYPSFREPHIKILDSIGISTGKIGSPWEEISQGYLEVDLQKLNESLQNHPKAVKDFFGSDRNGDIRIDGGFAYQIHSFLTAYTRPYGKGIIYNKIKSRKENNTQIDKNISEIEQKADRYEETLKRKFGAMESAIRKQKAIGEQLNNKLKPKK